MNTVSEQIVWQRSPVKLFVRFELTVWHIESHKNIVFLTIMKYYID